MEMRHLEQIVAICRAGSFSGAAKELGIAQPTLSKSIGRLEARLGIQLFERSNASARPTIYGQFVADHAAALLQNVTTLGHELEQLARGEAGSLRIGAGPATRLHPLPKLIGKVARAFPRLQIVTRFARVNLMMRALRTGKLDVVFCNGELATEQDDLIRIRVLDDRYIAVARAGHAALQAQPLSATEFMRLPLASSGLTPDFAQLARHGQCAAGPEPRGVSLGRLRPDQAHGAGDRPHRPRPALRVFSRIAARRPRRTRAGSGFSVRMLDADHQRALALADHQGDRAVREGEGVRWQRQVQLAGRMSPTGPRKARPDDRLPRNPPGLPG